MKMVCPKCSQVMSYSLWFNQAREGLAPGDLCICACCAAVMEVDAQCVPVPISKERGESMGEGLYRLITDVRKSIIERNAKEETER